MKNDDAMGTFEMPPVSAEFEELLELTKTALAAAIETGLLKSHTHEELAELVVGVAIAVQCELERERQKGKSS
jgi:hypothetical protein